MKKLMILGAITLSLMAGPALAGPNSGMNPKADLEGSLQGTTVNPAAGEVEIVSNSGHQFIKFNKEFEVASQAETEVRLVDGQTGKVSFVGYLVDKNGYQVYEVPEGMKVDEADRIVLYSPLHAEDLATVELSDE